MIGISLGLTRRGGGVVALFRVSIGSGNVTSGATLTATITPAPAPLVPSYQWTDDGAPIPGRTSASYAPAIGTDGVSDASLIRCVVTLDGIAYASNARRIVFAAGTAPTIAAQTFTVDTAITPINAAASGAGLTFTYAATGLPAGLAINASTGSITGTPTAASSGTAALTATDQYGRVLSYGFGFTASLRAQATGGADLDLSFVEDSAITSTNLVANWTTNGNTLTFVSVAPALPAGLSVNAAGSMTGTPTTPTADATYTLTMQDEYGRQTSDTFTLQITEASGAAVNPTLATATFTPGGSGTPPTLAITGNYTGAQPLVVNIAFGRSSLSFAVTGGQLTAMSGGTGVVAFADNPVPVVSGAFSLNVTLTEADLAIVTTLSGMALVDRIALHVRESGNTGVSSIQTVNITAGQLDGGAPTFASATWVSDWVATAPVITGVPTIAGTTTEGQTLTASPASATGDPTPTRTWQWGRSGVDVSGATAISHTLGAADVGQTLTVRQIETNSAGTASATSAATATIAPAVAPFSPASLFAGGEQGGWWDPSDLSTLWQDTAATIPVTTDGQAVARINDKAGRGNHLTQATVAARPVYRTSGGLHWLEFDGLGDCLFAAKALSLGSGAGFFVAHAQRELFRKQSSAYNFAAGGSGNLGRLAANIPWSDGNGYFDAGGASFPARINAAWSPVGTDTVSIQQRTTANVYSVRRNGAAFGPLPTNSAAISGTHYVIGSSSTAGTDSAQNRWYGTIFVEAQKSGDQAAVETWLGARAGLTL